MQLRHLTLTHIRAFSHAEITFQSGMNLIVGINGVGKSTILDTLRILLSQALPQFSPLRNKPLSFTASDFSVDALVAEALRILIPPPHSKPASVHAAEVSKLNTMPIIWLLLREVNPIAGMLFLKNFFGQIALSAELTFQVANLECRYLVHQPRFLYSATSTPTDEIRDQAYENVDRRILTPNGKDIQKSLKNTPQPPLAIYFSPRRALANISTKFTTHSKNAAFAEALDHRELRIMEFADWWLAQKALAAENAPNAQRHLDVLASALSSIIDTCTNIRAQRETFNYLDKQGKSTPQTNTTLLIDKAGTSFDLRQLSDGERGILALVLDLARRLSQANPHLTDPLQAAAVVLIDELDLHLHPQWQRTIVTKLTTTFPNCQFIATTHSPLIIGEVAPENIILIAEDGEIIHPDQSLGMDTDWILKYIMGATTRNRETEDALKQIANLIKTEDYDQAIDAIDTLREKVGEFPELVRLQTRVDRLQMLAE